MKRNLYDDDHEQFRSAFRTFLERHAVPHTDEWEEHGIIDRGYWSQAGRAGFIGFEVPELHGGLGISDFRYNTVINEEIVQSGVNGDAFTMANDVLAPYLIELTDESQAARWLPRFVSGELIVALALSEPQGGSDLAALATTGTIGGDHIVINGSKTFITSGASADLVLVLVRTGEADGRGMTLVAVEADTPGFSRGAPMHKIGRRAQDTAELFFSDCEVPAANIVGEPGAGFRLVMRNLARERLSIAVNGVCVARRALELALDHARERKTFGRRLVDHQTIRHAIAEMHTAIEVTQSHIDRCITALSAGELSAVDAAAVKFHATELEFATADRCLQLFGGYGYMEEYPIARLWRDARVTRIYGGANEIMREIVGRDIAGRP
jgi:alkylation response protein AidB-like acyl-CoA dehydrogenase